MINIVEKISPTEDISQDDFGVRVKSYKTLNTGADPGFGQGGGPSF